MNFYMWWWTGKNNEPNFGDALNPYLIEKLGNNVKVKYVSSRPYKECIIFVLSAIKHGRKPEIGRFRKILRNNHYALCIGSILNNSRPNHIVWGSGFMNYNETITGGKIIAVRGYETQKRLQELGFRAPDIVGDPALLVPLVFTPQISPIYEIGIIPHISDYNSMKNTHNIPIIDLRTNNIEETIQQICKCKRIFSTSLHGLIISHAYGIPALWIKQGEIGTDGFKFKDYFSSVRLPYYQPLNSDIIYSRKFTFPEEYNCVSLPDPDIIKKIQRNLLNCAPFPINAKYKSVL